MSPWPPQLIFSCHKDILFYADDASEYFAACKGLVGFKFFLSMPTLTCSIYVNFYTYLFLSVILPLILHAWRTLLSILTWMKSFTLWNAYLAISLVAKKMRLSAYRHLKSNFLLFSNFQLNIYTTIISAPSLHFNCNRRRWYRLCCTTIIGYLLHGLANAFRWFRTVFWSIFVSLRRNTGRLFITKVNFLWSFN